MLSDALEGVRVLDLSQYLPGPFATQILADLGARVLKIEPPAGDPMRSFPGRAEDGLSPWYKQVNAGKQVVRLDLKGDSGRETLARLVAAADVLLESYRPGVLERLGFGGERLRQLNPRLVHCALSGFGQTGPYRMRGGHDITYVALSGMLDLTGTAERPVVPFPPLCDYAGGKQAATAILAALLRRSRTGEGAFIDISLFETALSWQSVALNAARQPQRAFRRGADLLTGGAACYQLYRTADGRFVALGAIEEKFWSAFCTALERPDWISRQHDPLPQTVLIAELQALFAAQPLEYWQQRLGAVDCCFETVLHHSEVPAHPQVKERQMFAPGGESEPAAVLFPAWVDGRPPASRPVLEELDARQALLAWDRDDA